MGGCSNERALWLARNILPYEPALRLQLGRWRLPGDLDRDDVIQEAYSRLAAMDSVDHIHNPRAYLFSMARTIMLMHLRHRRVIPIRSVDDMDAQTIAGNDPSPETVVSDREQLHLLAMSISELPEPRRRAFLMRTVEGLSHAEIGNRLGMSDNAVQKAVAKSLLQLMGALGRGGKPDVEASIGQRRRLVRKRNVGSRDERGD